MGWVPESLVNAPTSGRELWPYGKHRTGGHGGYRERWGYSSVTPGS